MAVMMHEHTALSGQFARAFGNDRFEPVWPNDLMFYVVSHHDAGWAESQDSYDTAYRRVFDTLDELEGRLAERRYLCGDRITESDVRLFTTLVRFDTVYHQLYRCKGARLVDYPNLWAYARDLYRLPAFRQTTDFTSFGGLVRGPKPSFLNDASWRLEVEPRLADWAAPPGRDHLG